MNRFAYAPILLMLSRRYIATGRAGARRVPASPHRATAQILVIASGRRRRVIRLQCMYIYVYICFATLGAEHVIAAWKRIVKFVRRLLGRVCALASAHSLCHQSFSSESQRPSAFTPLGIWGCRNQVRTPTAMTAPSLSLPLCVNSRGAVPGTCRARASARTQ